MIKDTIVKKLVEALAKIGIQEETPLVEHPANLQFGDYSTNVALKHAKSLGKNPYELALQIRNAIEADEEIEKIEVVKPGFINFWISKNRLTDELISIIRQKDHYGKTKKQNRKILVEFGGPNTHKLPHLGHLFSYVYGNSVANILEAVGNSVMRVNYQGDIGLHVAKCLYVLQKNIEEGRINEEKLFNQDLMLSVLEFQRCYQEGSQLYENDPTIRTNIDLLNKDIYEKKETIFPLWEKTRKINVKFYENTLEKELDITYQKHYWESETIPEGKKIVKNNIGDIFEESEGAVIFKGEKYGLHTRVFINKHGNPTYEAKDIGLISLKMKDFTFDLSLVITAAEQNEYWRVVKKATEVLFPKLNGKIKHLGFGMINLTTGKMSSRTGHIINAIELIDIITQKIQSKFTLTHAVNLLDKKIAIAAIKYSFLRSDAFSNITFDMENSISKDGDSGPYLLYTYVRCLSLLKGQNIDTDISKIDLNDEEKAILRKLYIFPEVIEKISHTLSPHLITSYLFDLAQRFNLFYQKHSVLKSSESIKNTRLLITLTTAQVIKNGLCLLGIKTVEKM